MPRSKGRTGRPWRRARAACLTGTPTCWLCGEPIDTKLPPQHPYSATVDHVIPLSLGGPPTSPANLRPAHKRCNSSRGNRLTTKPTPPATASRNW
jgi:5-methylcytosine-specific restriction endonuclease McrA